MNKEKLERKNCNESCECNIVTKKTIDQKTTKIVREKIFDEKKLDPTHFGDWQVNCRHN